MATSVEQTRPIFDIVAGSWNDEAIAKFGLEIGKEAIVKTGPNRGRLAVIANSPRTLRGARPTAVFVDETSELVDGNHGHESIRRINGNLDKNPGGRARRLDLSNAFVPGEDSVAEKTMFDWSEQKAAWGYSHILLDSLEANPALRLDDEDELREAIRQAAGDATWLDVERLVRAAKRPGQPVSVFRREHLNQITSEEDSLISAQNYDTQAKAEPLQKGDRVTLGFDGSLSGDGTALVAYRFSDRSFHVLHYQEPPKDADDWRVDEEEVDAVFRKAMTDYSVWGAACDVHPFESWVLAWNRDFGDKMKVPASTLGAVIRDNRSARRDLTLGCESMVGEIESEKLIFEKNNFRMRSHWLNAKRAENSYGFSFRKATKSSTKRVDIVAACLMAYLIAQRIESANIQEKVRRGTAMSW
jgi:phage terminase large subunit-like protein